MLPDLNTVPHDQIKAAILALPIAEQGEAIAAVEQLARQESAVGRYEADLEGFLDEAGDPWQKSGSLWRSLPAVRHVLPVVEAWATGEPLELENGDSLEVVRLMLLAPTQTLKTTLGVAGCSLRIRRWPEQWCGYVTNTAARASRRSAEARELYHRAGGQPRKAQSRADWWRTPEGGGMWSAGIGGGAGERTHAVVCDDLDKNPIDAAHLSYQRAVDTSLDYVIEGRQTKLALAGEEPEPLRMLWIQSRMPFENDSTGRYLERAAAAGESWVIVPLAGLYDPAVLDFYRAMSESFIVLDDFRETPGEPLMGTAKTWIDKASKSASTAAGMDQQNPAAASASGLYRSRWLRRIESDPGEDAYRRSCRAHDLAETEGGGDWSASVKQAVVAETGRRVLRHGCRAQKASRGAKRMVAAAALLDGPRVTVLLETKKGMLPEFSTYVRRIHAQLGLSCPPVLGVPPKILRRGKLENFRPFADRCHPATEGAGGPDDIVYGQVDLVTAPWTPEIRDVVPALAQAIEHGFAGTWPTIGDGETLEDALRREGRGDSILTREQRAELGEIERAGRDLVVTGGLDWYLDAGPEWERFPGLPPDDYVDAASYGDWWLGLPSI